MVKYNSVDSTFSALSDSTRLSIVEQLSHGRQRVSKLGEPFNMSAPAISKHIRVLEEAGIIIREKQGREVYCTLRVEPLSEATRWIEQHRAFWLQNFASLEKHLKGITKNNKKDI